MPGKHYKGLMKITSANQKKALIDGSKNKNPNFAAKIASMPITKGLGKYKGEGSFSMKNAALQKSARYGDPMQKNFLGKVLGAGIMGGMPKTTPTPDFSDPKQKELYANNEGYRKHLASKGIKYDASTNTSTRKTSKKNDGITKTYKEAYKTRGKKYQDMDEATYIKQAKAYNKKEYNTEKPSDLTYTNKIYKQYGEKFEKRRAAQDVKDRTGVDKKRNEAYAKKKEASAKKKEATKKPKVGDVTKSEKAKGNLVVNEKLMKNAEKNQRVSKATVTEKKKPIGPKERTTVKKAKATKKAGVKDAKQKGYETRKDRRAAVSDARKSGRAGVKEARKNKRDLKKAEKNTRKRDKKEVKAAITDAKRAAKIDKLKSKKSTNKRSNKIDDLQAKRKLNSDEPLAKKYKNASQRKAVHASKAEQNKK